MSGGLTTLADLQNQIALFDAQMRRSLGNGVATQVLMSATAPADGVIGDVVCVAQGGPVPPAAPTVTAALTASLANASRVLGVLVDPIKRGTSGYCAMMGVVPPSVTGLAPGNKGLVRVNPATGRCQRVSGFQAGDFPVGSVDSDGNLTLYMINDVGQGTGWTTAYVVDLTSLVTQNLKTGGDGTKTIDGKSWTLANSAAAAAVALTNGTGLVIDANSTATNYNGGTRTSPILTVPILTLFPGYSVQNHILRVSARVLLTNSDANFEFAGFGLEGASSPTNENVHVLKGFSNTPNRIQTESDISAVTGVHTVSASSTDDVLCVVWEGACQAWEGRSGLYAGTFPLSSTTLRYSEMIGMVSPPMAGQAGPMLSLYQLTLNSNAAFTATFTHLAVEYFAKNPS